MTEPSSDSPATDDQDGPGLLDRVLGRSDGSEDSRDSGPVAEQVDEQEEQVDEREAQGTEEQPAQPAAGASSSDSDDHEDEGTSEDPEEHDDLGTDADGEPSVGAMPDADDVDEEAIEQERSERLDPENRPDNVEIDNTDRTFDSEKGMFTDDEGYDEAESKYDDDAV